MVEEVENTLKEILSKGKEAESNQNFDEAFRIYSKAINADPINEYAYNRLMLLLRKRKEYKKELEIINTGIKAFEEFYESKMANKSKTITALSNKLNKSFGLADKKGNSIYNPEPIAKWKKRKLIVKKKLNKK